VAIAVTSLTRRNTLTRKTAHQAEVLRQATEYSDGVRIFSRWTRKNHFGEGACLHVDRAKTVSKLLAVEVLGLALSEKQIPQIVEKTKKCGKLLEPLERDWMRPRQVRYQAALRPDFLCPSF